MFESDFVNLFNLFYVVHKQTSIIKLLSSSTSLPFTSYHKKGRSVNSPIFFSVHFSGSSFRLLSLVLGLWYSTQLKSVVGLLGLLLLYPQDPEGFFCRGYLLGLETFSETFLVWHPNSCFENIFRSQLARVRV